MSFEDSFNEYLIGPLEEEDYWLEEMGCGPIRMTLADLRATVAKLEDLPGDTPIGVLYDSDFGRAKGIEFYEVLGKVRDGFRPGTAIFSISDYQ